jgi:hypothetical protein
MCTTKRDMGWGRKPCRRPPPRLSPRRAAPSPRNRRLLAPRRALPLRVVGHRPRTPSGAVPAHGRLPPGAASSCRPRVRLPWSGRGLLAPSPPPSSRRRLQGIGWVGQDKEWLGFVCLCLTRVRDGRSGRYFGPVDASGRTSGRRPLAQVERASSYDHWVPRTYGPFVSDLKTKRCGTKKSTVALSKKN